MAHALTIVDLKQEEELSSSEMAAVIGGAHDYARDNAIVALILQIRAADKENNQPDPPQHVSMHLPS